MDDHNKRPRPNSRPKKPWLVPLCLIAAGVAGIALWVVLRAGNTSNEPDWQARPGLEQGAHQAGQATTPSQNDTQNPTAPSAEGQTPATHEGTSLFLVETPYFTAELPAFLRDVIHLEESTGDGYNLRCYGTAEGEKHLLFDFSVGGNGSQTLGILEIDGKEYPVFAEAYPLTSESTLSEDARQTLLSAQEQLNTFLSAVYGHPGFREAGSLSPTEPINLGAVTSYGTLTVPAVWEEHMWAVTEPETGGESVTFFALVSQAELPLYSVLIGTDPTGADLIGFLTLENGAKAPVSLLLYDCPTGEGYTDADRDKFLAMQEEVNHTLAELSGWPGFISK